MKPEKEIYKKAKKFLCEKHTVHEEREDEEIDHGEDDVVDENEEIDYGEDGEDGEDD
jgi:hypothetical protein